jgi:hypothetical protein
MDPAQKLRVARRLREDALAWKEAGLRRLHRSTRTRATPASAAASAPADPMGAPSWIAPLRLEARCPFATGQDLRESEHPKTVPGLPGDCASCSRLPPFARWSRDELGLEAAVAPPPEVAAVLATDAVHPAEAPARCAHYA